jgi:DNA-binding MarR family transcriptional regulator
MKPPHELCYSHAARGNARFLSRLYDRHLAPSGINIQQLTILSMILHHPGILIAELAEQMIMERTTLARALRPLQDAGYVDSEPFGTRRSLALTISPSGRQKAAQAFPLWSKAQQEFETIFGVKNAKTLRGTMQRASRLG